MVSDVKSKTKKMDVRLPGETFEELSLVAWGCEKKRSELLRMMITDFMARGTLEIEGQRMTWAECVRYARVKMFEQDLSMDDLQRSRGSNKQALSEPLNEELESFADEYAQKALRAFKKHVGA